MDAGIVGMEEGFQIEKRDRGVETRTGTDRLVAASEQGDQRIGEFLRLFLLPELEAEIVAEVDSRGDEDARTEGPGARDLADAVLQQRAFLRGEGPGGVGFGESEQISTSIDMHGLFQ